MDKNSNFKVSAERPQKLVGMVVRSNDKLKIHPILRHTGTQQVTTLTSSRTSRSILGIGINYTSLSDITTTKPDTIHPTTGEASSTLSRKENNCYISIVGINSYVPQVAPRTTREYPTSTAISLTQFFFPV